MFIQMTPQQQQLQQDVRDYMAGIMTAQLRQEMSNPEWFEGGGPVFRQQLQRMGADGWIGLSWPESLGGKNWDPIEQYIFTNEVIRAGFPYPFLTIDAVAPVLAEHAGEELPDVVSGVRQGGDAREAVQVAKIWCGDVAQRLSQASQHLHGGIGVDRDYPLFRYCLWARQLELALGGSAALRSELGAAIARQYAHASA